MTFRVTLFRSLLVMISILSGIGASAQLVVDNTLTVEQYVQDVLLGTGVTVSNITFNGTPGDQVSVQVGSFDSQNANVGIDLGMMMATGNIIVAQGPNDQGGGMEPVGPFPEGDGVSDPDLEAINPGFELNDAAVLEFDFIPTGDSLQFNYVWASEEYPVFVNSSFNDVFGFFLSGPGINGPYSNNAVNIALVPGTTLPVTIDNVNNGNDGISGPCVNCEYYNHNGSGWWDPMFPQPNSDSASFVSDQYIQFNGITNPLTAIGLVECGLEYHIKIALADAGDQSYDSAVFLEAGSFSSNSVVDVNLEITVGNELNTLFEECGEAIMTFTRDEDSPLDLEEMVIITYDGTAENGLDYSLLPDTVFFPPGVEQVEFIIDAFDDGITEGDEIVNMTLLNLAACNGNGLESEFTFTIKEVTELVTESYEIEICYGEDVEIGPPVSGAYGEYTYNWNTGSEDSSIVVTPLISTDYQVIVGDTCDILSQTVDISVIVSTPIELDAGQDHVVDCNDITSLFAEISGGTGDEQFEWSANGIVLGDDQTLDFNTEEDVVVIVTVSESCGTTASDEVVFQVVNPEIDIDLINQVSANCILNAEATPEISGGAGNFEFEWLSNGNVIGDDLSISYLVTENQYLYFNVTDGCGTTDEDSVWVVVDDAPPIIAEIEDMDASCIDILTLFAEIDGGIPDYSFEWYADGILVADEQVFNFQPEETTQMQVIVTDICGIEDDEDFVINLPDVPMGIEISPDTSICFGDAIGLNAFAFGGEENITYLWNDMETTTSWIQVEPTSNTTYTVVATDLCGETISASVSVDVQNVEVEILTDYLSETHVEFTGIVNPDPCIGCIPTWDFGDGTAGVGYLTDHEYAGLTTYQAEFLVVNEIGCRDSATTLISPPVYLYIPNAFTPDGDGTNDVFQVQGTGIVEFEMMIFNRWGEKVAELTNLDQVWQGNSSDGEYYVQDGVYVYVVKYRGVDEEEHELSGHITVLR